MQKSCYKCKLFCCQNIKKCQENIFISKIMEDITSFIPPINIPYLEIPELSKFEDIFIKLKINE